MRNPAQKIKTDSRLASKARRYRLLATEETPELTEKAAYFILLLPEEIPWWSGLVYDGHTLKRTDDGWLLVIRARKGGEHLVTFSSGETIFKAVQNFAWELVNNRVTWKPDKYAKNS